MTLLLPVKIDGEIKTALIEQPGPISYLETTTLTNIMEEDLNRMILANTDESPEQTRLILSSIAASRSHSIEFNARRQHVIEVHHAIQRLLAGDVVTVVIPYAELVAELFPSGRTGTRRAFGHLLNFIEAVTLLHRYQRRQNDDGAIVATLEDYHIARHLLLDPIQRAIGGGLSDGARRFRDRLHAWVTKDGKQSNFTSREAIENDKSLSDRSVRGFLTELAHAGWLECLEEQRGPKPARWRLPEREPDEADAMGLPTVEQLQTGMPEVPAIHVTAGLGLVNAVS